MFFFTWSKYVVDDACQTDTAAGDPKMFLHVRTLEKTPTNDGFGATCRHQTHEMPLDLLSDAVMLLRVVQTKQIKSIMSTSSDTQTTANATRYTLLIQNAFDLKARGELRPAADKFLEATLAAPSKWAEERWRCFSAHLILVDDWEEGITGIPSTPTDRKALKRIAKDEAEPAFFRQQALMSLAIRAWEKEGDYELAANYSRLGIDAIWKVRGPDRRRQVTMPSFNTPSPIVMSVGDIITDNFISIHNSLKDLENPENVRKRHKVPNEDALVGEDVVQRLVVGGDKCDCCGKERCEVVGGLFRCTKCKLSYYCSPACQHKQWKDGHKKCCRTLGDIKPRDWMILIGLKSRPKLNASLIRVVGLAAAPGQWDVSVLWLSETITVVPENLVHIRPAK